ncbi:TPA: YopX family protein [Streptococcus pyogenes]|uniref:YopX family protein n=1 Tax=Streptococcus pyogenes TaxID=1314 RepID=UPI000E052D82|nr:YopX family protein [Streptococcus pyogenes]HER4599759.1 hypothetical protein [Streptococcus pyogenes NGAS606]HER4726472.1 hypothetical protein [Streptococcus pyogenes NGAS312]SUO66230.1 phage protein [Streptococcus pyogenes]VED83875.1 phage protein [Streptococcus pyogenes]VGS58037.1 phage protein [Streptococcus pyogenes]
MIPKFRAWSTFKNEWVKHFYITESGLIYNMEQPHRDLIGAVPVEKSGLILMQSTGLFDKNGVEIFEGDVVEYDDGEYLFAGKVVKTVFGTYVKSYSFFSFEDFSDENTMTTDVEIIGNIYEESVEE